MSETVIEFKDVDMSFGDKTVLDHVSFSVEKGETVAIIGPSGTGKSTTLKLLIGLLEPMGGSVRIKGREVNHFTEKQWNDLRLHMGMVFQYSALFDFLTVEENVAFGLKQHTHMLTDDIKLRVRDLLSSVGLSGNEKAYPAELSGGMKSALASPVPLPLILKSSFMMNLRLALIPLWRQTSVSLSLIRNVSGASRPSL